jgi:fructose-specific phosphotransferase system IIC component
VRLFVLLVVAGGAGGLVGSIIGAALGHGALFIGGLLGGLIASPCAAYLAARLHWIDARETKTTALGAALGFLAAAIVAVNTLSSPIGPVLSTLLVGTGGLVGRRLGR